VRRKSVSEQAALPVAGGDGFGMMRDGRRSRRADGMTVRIITGSKQQIAEQVARMPGEVREAIVFIDEATSP
jgi:hypothetical protein